MRLGKISSFTLLVMLGVACSASSTDNGSERQRVRIEGLVPEQPLPPEGTGGGPQGGCGSVTKRCGNCRATYDSCVQNCCTFCSTMSCFGGCSMEFAQCVALGGPIETACCKEPAIPANCGDHCPDGDGGTSSFGGSSGVGGGSPFGGAGGVIYDPCQGVTCSVGQQCVNGFCEASGCSSDWDCPVGQTCWGGVCEWGSGQTCVLDGVCSAGETCACDAYCCGGGSTGSGSGPGGACR